MKTRMSAHLNFLVKVIVAIVAVGAVVLATMYVASNYLSTKSDDTQRACTHTGKVYTVTIKDARAVPSSIHAKRCDALVIVNLDATQRLMAFGRHDSHIAYDGISEMLLSQGQSMEVRLSEIGTFRFHDHYQDEASGTFTVSR